MRYRFPLLLVCLLVPALAHADDEARQHFDAGIALVQKHDFAAAIVELERSYEAKPLPETLFDIALCQRELGRFLGARASLRRYLDALPPSDANKAKIAEATQLLTQTEAQLATLVVVLPAEAELRVDHRPVTGARRGSVKLDPGTHHVEGVLPDRRPVALDVTLASGELRNVELVFPPPVAPPVAVLAPSAPVLVGEPMPRPRLVDTTEGRAAIGLGAATLAIFGASAVTGGVVLADKSRYHDSCNGICDGALYNRAHTLAVTTDVLIGVGGAAAVASLVLFLVHPKHRSAH
jgi:hypothetical protein